MLETCLSSRDPWISSDEGIQGSTENNFPLWPSAAAGEGFGRRGAQAEDAVPASQLGGRGGRDPPTETLRACPNTLTATFSEPNSAAEVLVLELRRLLFCCTDPTQSPYQDVAQVCCTLRFSIKHGSNFFSSDGLGPPSWKLLKAAMEVVKNA